MAAGYRQIDHTADLAIEVWADSEEALFAEGARAIIDLVTGDSTIATTSERRFEVEGVDHADLFVRWLNTVLFAATVEGYLVDSTSVVLEPERLVARTRGEAHGLGRIVQELKAVTYHDLSVEGGAEGWRARVVIDV